MLKRTTQIAKATGEAIGIIQPSLADARTAAEEHRQNLVVAQSALEAAEQTLQTAHDRNADNDEVLRLEAASAAAKAEATRAEARYRGAEKRLKKADGAEQARTKAAARAKLEAALLDRLDAAKQIDVLAALLAKEVQRIDAQDGSLAEAIRAGVASRDSGHVMRRGKRVAEFAMSKYGAINTIWLGDPTQHPDAAELIAKVNAALAPMTA